MKKGGIYEGTVEKVAFANKGHLSVDGEAVVVKNAVPGQKIRFQVNKKRKSHCEGRLLEVLERSPLETESPKCSLFPECGGCTYQTMSHDAQLEMKLSQVRELLKNSVQEMKLSGETLSVDESLKTIEESRICESPDIFHYRNKMEFAFGNDRKDGPLTLGLHKKGSMFDILDVTDCAIVHKDVNTVTKAVREYCAARNLTHYHKMTHQGFLRDLLIRRSSETGEILAAIVTSSQETENFADLVDVLLNLDLEGSICGILHMINDSVADVVKSEKTTILYGKDYFYEKLLNLDFKITPFSFFQTNSKGAEVLYSTAREMIGDVSGATVFDLYSGTGTIAQVLAPAAKKVVGVEIVEEAVEAAKENAVLNGIENCEFLCGDVLKVIDEIEEKPDFLILDPPREGIHPKAIDKLIAYGVERIVYISCKPTSLANDLKSFLKAGYVLKKMRCVDMFPHTVHVETVVLLSKGVIDSQKIKVEFSLEDLDITSFRGKATYEQIKDYVLQQTGMKVSSLYISQVKRKCGLDVGDSYNKPKTEDVKQPQCPPEKETAIMDALKHFGLIK